MSRRYSEYRGRYDNNVHFFSECFSVQGLEWPMLTHTVHPHLQGGSRVESREGHQSAEDAGVHTCEETHKCGCRVCPAKHKHPIF